MPYDRNSLAVNDLLRKLPDSREERWNVLKTFFSGWYAQIGPADGFADQEIHAAEVLLNIRFPKALREWYMLAGRRSEVWSRQDHFILPERLAIKNEKLVIYRENQSVVRWAIPVDRLVDDDPPVLVSDPRNPENWMEECPDISTFALSQMLRNTKFSEATTYSGNGQATDASLHAITQNYELLGFPDLAWPPSTRLYGGDDLVIEVNDDSWIWVSGRSSATFHEAVRLIGDAGVKWEQLSEPQPT